MSFCSARTARCAIFWTIGALVTVAAAPMPAQGPAATAPSADGRRGLVFAENRGQHAPEVKFRSLLSGQVASFTADGLVLTQVAGLGSEDQVPLRGHTVRLRFVDARTGTTPSRTWVGSEPASTHASWFRGRDPARWVTAVPCWAAVRLADVVPGVTVEVHGRSGVLEYDLLVEPGARVEDLEVVVEGADAVTAQADASLVLSTPLGEIRHGAPASRDIEAGGRTRDLASTATPRGPGRFGFSIDGHDPSKRLVVDPQFAFATFVEGSGGDFGLDVKVDGAGAAFVAGKSTSADFPTSPGAFDPSTIDWNADAVIFKLDPSGTTLGFATFLGGSGVGTDDQPGAVHVDSTGLVTVAGTTTSADFPVTPGAFQSTLNGVSDTYVTRFNATGTALVFSTLYGGSSNDTAYDMAVDSAGRVVIGGETKSLDLPVSRNAVQATNPSSSWTAFVARLSADGSSLDYGSYFGGNIGGRIDGVAVDLQSSFYIGGRTSSDTGFPVTPGAFQQAYAGWGDAFVAKFHGDGQLSWSTLLGGGDTEMTFALEVDSLGQAILAGDTRSWDYPSTPGAFDVFLYGDSDGFVSKLTADGAGLVFSGFLGGSSSDFIYDLAVETSGACVLTGQASTPGFPITPDAAAAGLDDPKGSVFVTRITPNGEQIAFSGRLGAVGNGVEYAFGVAVDSAGFAYVTGYTTDPTFPTTPGSFDPTLSGSTGLFVVKLDLSPWTDLGGGLAGTAGVPQLAGGGTLQPGSPGALQLASARPLAPCWLVIGLSSLGAPFKGGVMFPAPDVAFVVPADAAGAISLPWPAWPAGLPAGTLVLFQCWIPDPLGPSGWAASNGLRALLPVVITDT